MKPLHTITVVPPLSHHQLASLGRAMEKGLEVRIRVTPVRGYVSVEYYKTEIINYWDRVGWKRLSPGYHLSTKVINNFAEIGAQNLHKVPVVTK